MDIYFTRGDRHARINSDQTFTHSIVGFRTFLYFRFLATDPDLAFWMDVACRRTLLLSGNDYRDLRHAGNISYSCRPESIPKPQPHLVHRVVERGAWRNHGCAIIRRDAYRTSLRRCPGVVRSCRCIGFPCSSQRLDNQLIILFEEFNYRLSQRNPPGRPPCVLSRNPFRRKTYRIITNVSPKRR